MLPHLCPPIYAQRASSTGRRAPRAPRTPHSRSPPVLQVFRAEPHVTSEAHVRNPIRARLGEDPRSGYREQPAGLCRVNERYAERRGHFLWL